MHSVIIDDQESACLILEQYADMCDVISTCSSFQTADDAFAHLQDNQIDLLFLDIHMPETTGFEFLRKLDHKPLVIFTTFDKNYAVDAFEQQAVDYLVKPIKFERFKQAAKRAQQLLDNNDPVVGDDELFVKVDQQLVRLEISNILFIEAKGDYVNIQTTNGVFLVHATLKKMTNRLPAELFMSTHRSFLVNLSKITGLQDKTIQIGKYSAAVSKANREELITRLNVL